MRVCGIDPGVQRTGYAVVGGGAARMRVIEAGVIRTDGSRPLADRLVELAEGIRAVFEEHAPQRVAVEALYSHYRHPRTAILMGHARGVIFEAAGAAGIEVVDYAPARVKKVLTGNGRAGKQQVQRAIAATLGLRAVPEPPDVADALAVALCAVTTLRTARSLGEAAS